MCNDFTDSKHYESNRKGKNLAHLWENYYSFPKVFVVLFKISSYPEDFLFIFEGVLHLTCTFPLHPLPQIIPSALGLPE